ncbi:peroxisome assembly protein (Peroxin-2) [Agyrium rufum]|nr:peroxisome assembly protein (Peroxin-2) [Agyrium rufum]
MTSLDFAAAQQRVLQHQQAQATAAHAALQAQRARHDANPLTRLPFPLGAASRRGLVVWDDVKGRGGTKPAFRVGQVDSELLDEELLELLKGQVGEGLKLFGSHIQDEYTPEILLILRAVLFKLSIWDHNASYGATLQNLHYVDARNPSHYSSSSPSRIQKSAYSLVTVFGRYAWQKWSSYLITQEGGYDEPTPRVRLLSRLTELFSTTHSIAAFASFLVFLVNGRYRTLLDRILRIRLMPARTDYNRQVSFEYLNRQLVWHAFTEFLLFLLPLVGIGRWRRWIGRAWRNTKKLVRRERSLEFEDEKRGELAFLPERTCAICYHDQNPTSTSVNDVMAISGAGGGIVGSAQTDITNPYETIPCRCVYCFVCIATKLEAEDGEGWVCLRCGELVKECQAWGGDVIIPQRRKTEHSKTVSFRDDEIDVEGDQRGEKDSALDMNGFEDNG